jgi:hypothetical protein
MELIFRLACDFGRNGEQTACESVSWGGFDPCRRNIQSLKARSSKCASGDVLHRHFYDAVNRSIRRGTHDAPPKKAAIPEIAF